MKRFCTSNKKQSADIYVEDGKVIEAHYENYGQDGGVYNSKRHQSNFNWCLRDCMSVMVNYNLDAFKKMMNEIKDDTECYKIGEELLAEKRKRIEAEAQKYTL